MMGLQDQHWYNLNANRRYPIDETASGLSDAGEPLPSVLLADCVLRFPNTIGQFAYLSAVMVGPHLVTLCFSASNEHPGLSSLVVPDEEPSYPLLATLTLQKPVDEARHYVLQAEQDGVAGWVVFGSNLNGLTYRGTFSTSAQSALLSRCGRSFRPPGVTSLGKDGLADTLTGLIKLHAGNDLTVTKQEMTIAEIGTVTEAIVVGLKTSLDYDVFDRYKGQCASRPSSGTCRVPPLTSIGGVLFDCDGNLTLNITGATVTPLVGFGIDDAPTATLGLVVDFGMGFEQTCARAKGLPDADGNLPALYHDFCAISSSVVVNLDSLLEPSADSISTNEELDRCCYSFDDFAVEPAAEVGPPYWPTLISDLTTVQLINQSFSAVTHPISGSLCLKSMNTRGKSLGGISSGSCLDNSDPANITMALQVEVTFLRPPPYTGNPALGIPHYTVHNIGGLRLMQSGTASRAIVDGVLSYRLVYGNRDYQTDNPDYTDPDHYTVGTAYHGSFLTYSVLLDLNRDSLLVEFETARNPERLIYTNDGRAIRRNPNDGYWYANSPSYISPLAWSDLPGKQYGPLGLKPNHRYLLQTQYTQVYQPGDTYLEDLYYGKVYARIIDLDPAVPDVSPTYVNPGGVVIDYSAGLEAWPYQFNAPPIFSTYDGRVSSQGSLTPGPGFYAKQSNVLFDNYCVKNFYTELH